MNHYIIITPSGEPPTHTDLKATMTINAAMRETGAEGYHIWAVAEGATPIPLHRWCTATGQWEAIPAAEQVRQVTALWVPDNEARVLARHWNEYLQMTTYSGNAEWKGAMGRMERISLVGQRFVEPAPPEVLTTSITIRTEPSNEHDPNAIAAWYDGRRIGYVRKAQTATLHQRMNQINKENGPTLASTSNPAFLYLFDL